MHFLHVVFQRLLHLIPVLIGISIITFVLMQLTPGDPIRLLVGQRATRGDRRCTGTLWFGSARLSAIFCLHVKCAAG